MFEDPYGILQLTASKDEIRQIRKKKIQKLHFLSWNIFALYCIENDAIEDSFERMWFAAYNAIDK